jgi:hypothetical protein
MAVYVDDMNAPFRGMICCHLLADTHEELLAMADAIGMQRKWIQHAGTAREHFDIALSKKRLALKLGAQAITWAEAGQITMAKRAVLAAAREKRTSPHA